MILVQNGDHRAFSHLYDRYAPKLNAFFYRMLWSDKNMAEDHAHDLFSRIIERPQLYKSEYLVKPWLFKIASNLCKNAYRKRSFEMEYQKQMEQQGIQLPRIERTIDEEIMADQLHEELDKLDEDRRTMFLLRYQQDMSIVEIAETMDLPEGTIKSRLFYVKKFLSDRLEDQPKKVRNGNE